MEIVNIRYNGQPCEVAIRKPLAGERNKAVMKAETADGIKQTVLLVELIPYCIVSHPFGTTPIRQALDNLEIEDYDKILTQLANLMQGKNPDEAEKKSVELSEVEPPLQENSENTLNNGSS